MTDLTSELLSRVARIRPVIEEQAADAERHRSLTDPVYAALIEQRLFSLMLPAALGGMEVPPTVAYTVWEAVARIDSAAAWNLAQAGGGLSLATRLSGGGIEQIFGQTKQPIFAGAGFPPGTAERVANGYRVTGRVPFTSGCRRADWLFMPFLTVVDGAPETDPATGSPNVKIAFFPGKEVEIIDTWHTVGMRGTGSADIRVSDVFVPDALTVGFLEPFKPVAAFSGPLYRLGAWPVVQGEAVVSLGIAAAAIELLKDLAATKTPAMSPTLLRDRELVQHHIGRSRALVDAARSYLHKTTEDAYTLVASGAPLTPDDKVSLQLASCNAAQASAEAVDLVYAAAGSAAIRQEFGFERHFRDVHVLTQHATKSAARYVSAGRMMLGLPPDTPMLAL